MWWRGQCTRMPNWGMDGGQPRIEHKGEAQTCFGPWTSDLLWPLNNCSFKSCSKKKNCSFKSGNCFCPCSISAVHLCVFQEKKGSVPCVTMQCLKGELLSATWNEVLQQNSAKAIHYICSGGWIMTNAAQGVTDCHAQYGYWQRGGKQYWAAV